MADKEAGKVEKFIAKVIFEKSAPNILVSCAGAASQLVTIASKVAYPKEESSVWQVVYKAAILVLVFGQVFIATYGALEYLKRENGGIPFIPISIMISSLLIIIVFNRIINVFYCPVDWDIPSVTSLVKSVSMSDAGSVELYRNLDAFDERALERAKETLLSSKDMIVNDSKSINIKMIFTWFTAALATISTLEKELKIPSLSKIFTPKDENIAFSWISTSIIGLDKKFPILNNNIKLTGAEFIIFLVLLFIFYLMLRKSNNIKRLRVVTLAISICDLQLKFLKADKEKADKEKADKEKADKEKADVSESYVGKLVRIMTKASAKSLSPR